MKECNCRGDTIAVHDMCFLNAWVHRSVDIIQHSLDSQTLEGDHGDIARGPNPSTLASRNLRHYTSQ